MQIDIQSLFADILPDPAKELEEKALTRSALLSKGMQGPLAGLAATLGYNSAYNSDRMRSGLNALTGGRMPSQNERMAQAAQNIDTTTPQGQAELLSIVRRERGPGAAEQLREAFLQRNRERTQEQIQLRNVAVNEKQADVSASQVANQTRQLDLQEARDRFDRSRSMREDAIADSRITSMDQVIIDGEARFVALRGGKLVMNDPETGDWVPAKGSMTTESGERIPNAYLAEALKNQESANSALDTYNDAMSVIEVLREKQPGRAGLMFQSALENFGAGDVDLQLAMKKFKQIGIDIAMSNLPAGPASDRDIALAREPIPSNMSDWKLSEQWLMGMAKQAVIKAERDMQRSNYIQQGGNPSQFDMQWNALMRSPEYVQALLSSRGLEFNSGGSQETDAARAERLRAERAAQSQPKPQVPSYIDEQRY